mmetsp:Transcript_14754/g.32122  ORF Transcript_14754/g.32122 Transcript_14754/m.32122 type:complete len:318 (+) Transcript_14754:215-1168(+)
MLTTTLIIRNQWHQHRRGQSIILLLDEGTQRRHLRQLARLRRHHRVGRHPVRDGLLQNAVNGNPLRFRQFSHAPHDAQPVPERDAYVECRHVVVVDLDVRCQRKGHGGAGAVGHAHDVGDHRVGGGVPPRARPAVARRAEVGAVHHHRVAAPGGAGQQVPLRHQLGRDVHREGAVPFPELGLPRGRPDELDGASHGLGVGEVHDAHVGYARAGNGFQGHGGPERELGQYGDLGADVVSLHVGGRVGLGKAQILRLLQDLVVVGPVLHLSQHVIGRAVADPHDLVDDVSLVARLQRVDDGYATADAGLVAELDTLAGV